MDILEGLPASVYKSLRHPVQQDWNLHQYLRFYNVCRQDQVGFQFSLARYFRARNVKACVWIPSSFVSLSELSLFHAGGEIVTFACLK
jgi:hypothetical protein